MTKTAIRELYGSMHECLDVLVNHAAAVPADLLSREIAGFGHPTVLRQLTHVLAAEAAWVHRLQLLPFRQADLGTINTIDDLRRVKAEVMAATIRYLDSTSDEELETKLKRYPERWVGPHRAPGFILLHLITHAFHHKGQIVAMLRLLGYPAPDTDMQRE